LYPAHRPPADQNPAQAEAHDRGNTCDQAGEDVRDGYSVHDMALWAEDGTLVTLARQTVAFLC
jgi:hypothetical protein